MTDKERSLREIDKERPRTLAGRFVVTICRHCWGDRSGAGLELPAHSYCTQCWRRLEFGELAAVQPVLLQPASVDRLTKELRLQKAAEQIAAREKLDAWEWDSRREAWEPEQ